MSKEEYVSINTKESDLIECYQIQIQNDEFVPILMGKYSEIPVPVLKTLKYKNHKLITISYILTKDEIDKKLYKLIGILITNNNDNESSYSIDLIYNHEKEKLEIILVNHKTTEIKSIKLLDKVPKKEDMLDVLFQSLLDENVSKILN